MSGIMMGASVAFTLSAVAFGCQFNSNNVVDGLSAQSRFRVNTDGTFVFSAPTGTAEIISGLPTGTYVNPTFAGVGSSVWIRVRVISGTFSSSAGTNVWLQVTGTLDWTKGGTTGGFLVNFEVDVSFDGGTTTAYTSTGNRIGYTHVPA